MATCASYMYKQVVVAGIIPCDRLDGLTADVSRSPGGRKSPYTLVAWFRPGPEIISGGAPRRRRIESTSSTIAKLWPRAANVRPSTGHVVAQVVEAELVLVAVGSQESTGAALWPGEHCSPGCSRLRGRGEAGCPGNPRIRARPGSVHRDAGARPCGVMVEVRGQGAAPGYALAGNDLGTYPR